MIRGLLDRARRPAGVLLLAVFAFGSVAACGHTTPFRHSQYVPLPDAAREPPLYRLLLLGDAGEPAPDEPVLAAARRWAGEWPERTLVVFLGDNAYPEGFTARRRADAEQRVLRQLAVVEHTAAEALFVPGNHDWAHGKAEGFDAILAQAAFVRDRARFLPEGGCPGPAALDLPADEPVVRIVALDTQWWLHRHRKPTDECPAGSADAVVAALERALVTPLPVVVAAHHPLATHGPHGGFFDWQDHLFPLTRLVGWLWLPLPGVGSLYPLVQWHVIRSDQDLHGARNRRMRAELERALRARKPGAPVLFAAGHEHALQILRGEAVDYILVSGAGSRARITPVGSGRDTVFAYARTGLMAVDVGRTGIEIAVVEPAAGGDTVVFRLRIGMPGRP